MPMKFGSTDDCVAFICQTCGEAFAPLDQRDWDDMRHVHNSEHGELARYERTTIGVAF